jgi:hypothetical protein
MSPEPKDIDIHDILGLKGYSQGFQEKFISLASSLKLTSTYRKEFLSLVDDIRHREDITDEEVIDANEIQEVLGHEEYNRQQKIETIRGVLKKRRYPDLGLREEKFQSLIKQLDLPPQIRVSHYPYFEKKDLRLSIQAGSKEEFQALLKKSNELIQQNAFAQLWDISQAET